MSEGFACPDCGRTVVEAEPEGDWVCAGCGFIHLSASEPPAAVPPPGPLPGILPARPPVPDISGGLRADPAERETWRARLVVLLLVLIALGLLGLAVSLQG